MNPVLRYLFRSILILSFLSFPISADLFSQTFLISNYNGQTVNTCSGTFYDSGGSAGPYSNNENYTVTFCSGTSDHLKFDFTALNIGTGDVLYIYDGPNTGSPLIGTYPGIIVLTPFTLYTSGTCLTFKFCIRWVIYASRLGSNNNVRSLSSTSYHTHHSLSNRSMRWINNKLFRCKPSRINL